MKEGIVVQAISGLYLVDCSGEQVSCSLRGNLKKNLQYSTSDSHSKRVIRARRPLVHDTINVGDRVRLMATYQGAGIIEEILPRTSQFSRTGFRGQERTLVCNLDQVLIVFCTVEPRLDPWLLDRFLIAAEAEGLTALIVANKSDLATNQETEELFGVYQRIGYTVLETSAKRERGLDSLRAALANRVSAITGPSGVGKSSLLNALQPGLSLDTASIGDVTHKGRHTTTAARLIPLAGGGWIADTPGLRKLEPRPMDRDSLLACYPEMREIPGKCRFDDCRHHAEPGCIIKQAVERGEIAKRRYDSFLLLATLLESGGTTR